jgi:prevent-host-death family protein
MTMDIIDEDDVKEIPVGRFKAECLALLAEVAATGEELMVTKRGRPLARVVPVTQPPSLLGSVRYLVGDEDLIRPIEDGWDAGR